MSHNPDDLPPVFVPVLKLELTILNCLGRAEVVRSPTAGLHLVRGAGL
jgi:hypothetical protein